MHRSALVESFAGMAERIGAAALDVELASLTPLLGSLVDTRPEWSVGLSPEAVKRVPSLAALSRGSASWTEFHIGCGRFAVASTGSVVLAEADHGDRLRALLCVHHIVLMPASAVVATLADAAPPLRRWLGSGAGRYITFASGPSRTSDIERVLAIGVHGPRDLTTVLVHGWGPNAN